MLDTVKTLFAKPTAKARRVATRRDRFVRRMPFA